MTPDTVWQQILHHAAEVTHAPVAAVTASLSRNGRDGAMLAAWLAVRLIPSWTQSRIAAALGRVETNVRDLLREARSRRRWDMDWHDKSDAAFKALKRLLPEDIEPAPEPSEADLQEGARNARAPGHGDYADNWGFKDGRGTNRAYLEEQNQRFADAMRRAGYRETTS